MPSAGLPVTSPVGVGGGAGASSAVPPAGGGVAAGGGAAGAVITRFTFFVAEFAALPALNDKAIVRAVSPEETIIVTVYVCEEPEPIFADAGETLTQLAGAPVCVT